MRLCVSEAHHLLRHLLWHVFVKLEQELNGVVVLVFSVELLGAVHTKPELQAGFDRIIFLSQFNVNAVVLLEERVLQQVLDGVSRQKDRYEATQTEFMK